MKKEEVSLRISKLPIYGIKRLLKVDMTGLNIIWHIIIAWG